MATNMAPKGMRDFMPAEKRVREYIKGIIRDEYRKNGFIEIETSQIENLENLVDSDGGENTKLIFKILKRGEKLNIGEAKGENDLADLGLRFDLTLPLTRFYANNKNDLPQVFKALQMGYVFRAERPQKGRYRTFMQCDVDTIGGAGNDVEIELISTIYKTLSRIGLKGITFKINDRRLLREIVSAAGFEDDDFSDIAITLDKIDKVGEDGVMKELDSKGYDAGHIDALLSINKTFKSEGLGYAKNLHEGAYENLSQIINVVTALYDDIDIVFDYSLVRGMGYYTGTIFEAYYEGSTSALGGGGRYDNMVEKMCGISAPACGFSIGYERLVDIISDEGIEIPGSRYLTYFYSESDDMIEVMKKADELRKDFDMVSTMLKKKKFGKQVSKLKKEGYSHFCDHSNGEIKELE